MSNDYHELHELGDSEYLHRAPTAARIRRLQIKSGKLVTQKRDGLPITAVDLDDPLAVFAVTKSGTTTGGGTDCTVSVRMTRADGSALAIPGGIIRGRLCTNALNGATASATTTIAAADGCTLMETHTADKDISITNKANASATGTLTVSGVVVDGQTVTIGSRVYQFRTGATALTSGNVAVDISARGTKAQGILTIAEPVTAGDTIVVGDQTYVFVTGTANAAGEIGLGADEAATKVNIPAAINGTDSINTANTKVTASAFSADVCTLTARYTGTQGNSIVTAELGQGLTHASNVFNAATLGTTTAGVDVSAANAITDLVTAITNDTSAVVTAVDGAGDTMVVTAITAGVGGNSLATTETMTNGAWGAATLADGATGDESLFEFDITNSADETLTFRIAQPSVGKVIRGDYSPSVQLVWSA